MSLGATYLGDGTCRFVVWAPGRELVEVCLLADDGVERIVALDAREHGYHEAAVPDVELGTRYTYRLDRGRQLPDPASRLQPDGVHGPSQVVRRWDAGAEEPSWEGLLLEDYVIYELHVGAFTDGGTFDGVAEHLNELQELGITAVELMPVAEFPGTRNWGYDGVFPFAAHHAYGGPSKLRHLVRECHRRGMAVVLDVVYNHLGPEGNYLGAYGPYFTDTYNTPWGDAINFDGPGSDEVRRYFIENALWWLGDVGVDALRLDAVHGIFDFSAQPFLRELALSVHDLSRRTARHIYLIAESDLNDARLLAPADSWGLGMDAQWCDDFHHALHALVTGERSGYYRDFGSISDLAMAMRHGYVYQGQYSDHRQRRHGTSPASIEAHRLVVCAQNHDQVGNRMLGERLSTLVDYETLKLVAGTVLLSAYCPMLFMGEEYGETAGFQYFISHSDPELVEAVRRGRAEEFASFGWSNGVPDPQDEATFLRSKLRRDERSEPERRALWELHRELLRLRRDTPSLSLRSNQALDVQVTEQLVAMRRRSVAGTVVAAFNFGGATQWACPGGRWRKLLDSAELRWSGPGSAVPDTVEASAQVKIGARSFVVLDQES